jgi:hypothetical protein
VAVAFGALLDLGRLIPCSMGDVAAGCLRFRFMLDVGKQSI